MYQPQYGNGFQPQPGYVTSNQPQNVTQTGITFQQLRQDLANYIASQQNRDSAGRQLLVEAQGPSGNWQSAAMDRLTQSLSMTVDLFARTQPGDLNTHYANALAEVYELSWASLILSRCPQLQQAPDIMPKMAQVQQLAQIMAQRAQQFQQAGMLQNHAIQQVPANQSWVPQQPMGYQQVPQPQYPQYQRPMMQQGYGGGMSAQAVQGAYQPQQPQQPLYQQHYQTQPQTAGGYFQQPKVGGDVNDVRVKVQRDIANGTLTFDENGLPRTIGANEPKQQVEVQQPTTNAYGFNGAEVKRVEPTFKNVNTIPAPQKALPDLPVAPEPNFSQEEMEIQRQRLRQALLQAGTEVEPGITEIDLADPKIYHSVKQAHEITDGEVSTLREDEVRYVKTLDERKNLVKAGYKFELDYPQPLAANPRTHHLFAIVTKDNRIRQEAYVMGDKDMKRDVHMDLLVPIRTSSTFERDPAAHKSLVTTTLGGVLHNRFEKAQQVLREGMENVGKKQNELREAIENAPNDDARKELEEKGKEEVDTLIKDVYANYTNQIALDYEKSIEPKDPDNEMTEAEKEAKRELNANRLTTHEYLEVVTDANVNDAVSHDALETILAEEPSNIDVVHTRTYQVDNILKVFDDIKDTEECNQLLADFFWKDNAGVQENGKPKDLTADDLPFISDLADYLVKHEESIPPEIWHYLNNRATRTFNKIASTIYGLDTKLEIDSFAYDWPLYEEWHNDLDEKEHPNKALARAFVECHMHNALLVLHESEKVVEPTDTGMDYMGQRCVTSVRNIRNSHIPMLAVDYGLSQGTNTISESTHPELYRIVNKSYNRTLDALRCRQDGIMHVHDTTITFNDGSRYRVVPIVGRLPLPEDEGYTNISLEYIPQEF